MKKTSLMLILIGFLFVAIDITFAGIDVLLDPVGYLLVFNGLRALELQGNGNKIRIGRWAALGMVLISALDLFLHRLPLLALLRYVAETGFYLLLLAQLAVYFNTEPQKILRRLCVIALVLGIAMGVLGVFSFWPSGFLAFGENLRGYLPFGLVTLVALAFVFYIYEPKTR